jgi:hypothetical protein
MEKNNKGGKERREIKWCFRAIDFDSQRPGCSIATSLLRLFPVLVRFLPESLPAMLLVIPDTPELTKLT